MNKLKHNLLRVPAIGLAFFVAMLSMGFTYNWEVCLDAEEIPVCALEKDNKAACSCIEIAEVPACSCADKSHNSCDLSFSKYVQFDFEVLINEFQNLIPAIDFLSTYTYVYHHKVKSYSPKYALTDFSLPPPKSVRTILCAIQTFII
tara:strand:+ start:1346 stop:1786 length:441 start_codon:yes stop_codon:yes gene_type:complete